MPIPLYHIDAFTPHPYHGNPAAVCVLDAWLDDATLQAIAAEMNLSETAFLVANDTGFDLRWFAPLKEVELCGHATLAAAVVVFERLGWTQDSVAFQTLYRGVLSVRRQVTGYTMDFPAVPARPCATPPDLLDGLGVTPVEVLRADDYLVVLAREADVRALQPDHTALARLDGRGVIVTARADDPELDFVSRFFAPKYGIPEDPVTGSAHCTLTPYWCDKVDRNSLRARQISARTGDIICERTGDRILLTGQAVLIVEGVLHHRQHAPEP